jgi:hypothetical protein
MKKKEGTCLRKENKQTNKQKLAVVSLNTPS